MLRWKLVFAAAVSLAAAPGALAAPVGQDDPCGDSRGYAFVDDVGYQLPPTERTPRFDLDRIDFAQTARGVRATFGACGPIGAPDALGGVRGLFAHQPDNCVLGILAEDQPGPGPARTATFLKSCHREGAGPTEGTPLADTTDERFAIALPASAITVEGDRLAIDVDRDGLTGEAALALAPGAAWENIAAVSAESLSVFGFGVTWSADGTYDWGYSAPTAYDDVATGQTLTLD